MTRAGLVSVAAWLTCLPGTTRAVDSSLDGTWKLSVSVSTEVEQTVCLLRLEARENNVAGSMIATVPDDNALTLQRCHRDGECLRLTFKGKMEDASFEGCISPRTDKTILGSYSEGKSVKHARLTRTEQTDLQSADIMTKLPQPQPFQALQNMNKDAKTLALQVFTSKEPEEKRKLAKQIAEIHKAVEEKRVQAYEEIVARHSDDAAVFEAALSLLSTASFSGADVQKIGNWALTVTRAAEAYGKRWQHEVNLRVAELLGASPSHGRLALPYARSAVDLLSADDTTAFQKVRTLQALVAAFQRAGKSAEARQTEMRLVELDDILDKEYRAAWPRLEVTATDGTNKKGSRVAVLEVFTGVHCPYSESLYLAFDAVRRTYASGDVILVQYHTLMSGLDPLANADTEARWKYYVQANPKQVLSTPAAFFNGRFETLGRRHGHGKKRAELSDDARKKYNMSSELIDEILGTSAGPKLTVRAERLNEKITIWVDVQGIATPVENMRLRLALVEDTIPYVGANNLRFHHHVVRAMPGGPEGTILKEGDSSHQLTVGLDDLRESARRYLDEHAIHRKVLPALYRPMDLERLRVIAFVQDNSSTEILQGCIADVPRGR